MVENPDSVEGAPPGTCQSTDAKLSAAVESFRLHLQAKGNTPHRTNTATRHVRELLAAMPPVPSAHDVRLAVGGILAKGRALSTCNAYLISIKSFFHWCERVGLCRLSLSSLEPYKATKDRRHERAAFTDEELDRLLAATTSSRRLWKWLDGTDRAALYHCAAWTGLRAGTLRVIEVGQFNLSAEVPHVRVRGDQLKSGKAQDVPIHPEPAAIIAQYLSGKLPNVSAFRMPPDWDVVKMLRADLKEAGLSYCDRRVDADGKRRRLRVLDFHALRRTFGTGWLRRGVPLTTVQRWMGHSTPTLTANLYNDVLLRDAAETFRQLPPIRGPRKTA